MADAATVSGTFTVLPDEIAKTISGAMTVTPADSTEKWYYKFTSVSAASTDLIAGYLGQTAIKTKEVIQNSLGGVLFIDEAYSLGNNEKRDSFAKECLDTLCESLTEHKDDLMVIIAGYEEQLDECFFAFNQGLNSRFTWRFHTDKYSPNELKEILIKKKKVGYINRCLNSDFKIENLEIQLQNLKKFHKI